MVAESVLQAVRVFTAGLGGTPAGNEESLIINVRSRFNTKFSGFENDHVAVAAFVFAVEPLVKYLISSTSLAHLKTQGRTATALHVHELFKIISARTTISNNW